MTGFAEFKQLFEGTAFLEFVYVIFSGIFLFGAYTKVKNYLVSRYQAEKDRDDRVNEALEAIRQYPEYRKQSLEIQRKLEEQIQELRQGQQANNSRLEQMEDDLKRRERNKLRARLLESYRYYTNTQRNPSQAWTRMEAEAFWELFRDYEAAGGDGYMHSEVQPAMEQLEITEVK